MFNKITFVGAGSMAESIISGIIAKGFLKPEQIYVTNRSDDQKLQRLTDLFGLRCTRDKKEALNGADVIILAMKPKDVTEALLSIKPFVNKTQLLVPVLAGVSTDYISETLNLNVPVVRAMPNTSAAIGFSATAIAGGTFASDEQIEMTKALFQTIGTTTVVSENDLHAVTGLSGSGPAYIYYFVEAMEEAAAQSGLNGDIAKELIVQTLVGAAEMLKTSTDTPSVLREKITSPGGTTQAGLETLEKYKYQEALMECIKKAAAKSVELGGAYTTKPDEAK